MSIESLMDSQVRVWRPTETRGTMGQVIEDYETVTEPSAFNGRMVPLDGRLANRGPGEQPAGRKEWYLTRDVDVRERDVLEIVSGPQAESRWRVAAQPDFPGAHHYEVVAEPWVGRLPGDGES